MLEKGKMLESCIILAKYSYRESLWIILSFKNYAQNLCMYTWSTNLLISHFKDSWYVLRWKLAPTVNNHQRSFSTISITNYHDFLCQSVLRHGCTLVTKSLSSSRKLFSCLSIRSVWCVCCLMSQIGTNTKDNDLVLGFKSGHFSSVVRSRS